MIESKHFNQVIPSITTREIVNSADEDFLTFNKNKNKMRRSKHFNQDNPSFTISDFVSSTEHSTYFKKYICKESEEIEANEDFQIRNHPFYTTGQTMSDFSKSCFFEQLESKTQGKRIFTISEASENLISSFGTEYDFLPRDYYSDHRWNIVDLFSIKGFSHDYHNHEGDLRIPNDYLILDKKAPDGYFITLQGLEFILKYIYLFQVSQSEKDWVELNS